MKSSYRVLKWVFLVGAMATLGSACVVTSGDGDDDGEGGEGGSDTPTAGKNSTAGTGGTSSAGTSSGGTAAAGTSAGGAAAGEGGTGSSYVPGVCEGLEIPSMLRDTALNADDEKAEFACRKCLKSQCGEAWSTCYGEEPTSACGYGSTEDAPGQFECIRQCFLEDTSGDDAETVLGTCEGMCLDQCEDDGFATSDTQDLLGCGQEKCLVDCFTP